MKSDREYLDSLIDSLAKSKRYFNSKLEPEPDYSELITLLDKKLDLLQAQSEPVEQNFSTQQQRNILREVATFFNTAKNDNREKIKQIEQDILQEKTIERYKQNIINQKINRVRKQLQQKVLYLKQKVNQSRSGYLNLFMPDSWLFQLQQLVDLSQIKVVKERKQTYIYSMIDNGESLEYIYHYILDLYQQRVEDTLTTQWSKINGLYADGGFDAFVIEAKQQLAEINLLDSTELEILQANTDSPVTPQFNLTEIVNPDCLKVNSRITFDYSYTQSSWFKLLTSLLIGVGIYSITKLYFGTGKLIGFFILIFQLINLATGQSVKSLKLKQHKKELQRAINNKYQILLRAVVEKMVNTLINSIDCQNQKYQEEIDTLAELSLSKLEAIESELKQYREQQKTLERDKSHIKSLLKSN